MGAFLLTILFTLIIISESQTGPTRKPYCPKWCPPWSRRGTQCGPDCACVDRIPGAMDFYLPCVWSPARAVTQRKRRYVKQSQLH
uniref:Putative secreted protein n=1 Tax=Amblyomma triste TaxID=251400 RepID=A0A023G3N3_AMBTT